MNISIDDKLVKEINEYCDFNEITDTNSFITNCLRTGFNIQKYGLSPKDNIKRENNIEDNKPVVISKKKIKITKK